MGSIKCPKCGTENDPAALECLMCGIVFAKYQASQQRMAKARLGTHEIDYKIIGDDMQIVEIELDTGNGGDVPRIYGLQSANYLIWY